jgi:hypothetical protein
MSTYQAEIKQKYQNGNIHRKLRVATSEREGKLSNPRGRAARARCMNFPPENFRKPAHAGHAGTMRQFPTGQVDSTVMRVDRIGRQRIEGTTAATSKL